MSFGDRRSQPPARTWDFPVKQTRKPLPKTERIMTTQQLEPVHNPPPVADEWSGERLDLLKRTICKDSTNDEFALFVEIAKRSGLNPFARQIHAVKRNGQMTIQTGIDGYRLIADRTGKYAGSDDPVFDNEKEPNKATVTVYKLVGGTRCPFTATARWDEYFPGDKLGFMWKKMPCVMLGKCAESLALRKAFPAELSGLYTNEEMDQAERGGVYPEQPAPGDGFQSGEYLCSANLKTFPDLVLKPISQADPSRLREAVVMLENKCVKAKKDPSPWMKEFIAEAEIRIAEWENIETVDDGPDFNEEPGAEG